MLGSQHIRRYCRYCGSSVTPNDAFCSHCGKRLASREGVAQDERGAQPPSRAGTRHASFSRFWSASVGRMPQQNHLILILVFGFLAAAYIHPVVGLLTILIGALLAWAIRKRNPPSATAAALSQRLASVRFMSGPQFEHFVADIMRGLGYRAHVLGGSGDQGVDVIATGRGERIAIQCKQHAKPVNNKPVQEVFAGAKHHECTRAMVVAPMGYTKGAFTLAKSVGVDLYDTSSLRGWIWQIDRRERNQANEGNQANFEPRTVDLDEIDRRETNQANFQQRVVDLDESEGTMEGGAKKHTIKVGTGGTVGETVSFTAEHLGKVELNGGGQSGTEQGVDYTFYRLPDGTFRVLVERGDTAILIPSDMSEALSRGQRNNFSYGRMTLEELKAHPFNFGPAYDALMENHPETVRNKVRDLD